jgi:hypothetical protein
LSTEAVAQAIVGGLLRDREEIVIGISKLARLLGRLAPGIGFALMNSMEERSALRAR